MLNEEGFAVVREEVAKLLAERRRHQIPDLSQAKARLSKVEQEITNLVEAIKQGIITPSTKAELVKGNSSGYRMR